MRTLSLATCLLLGGCPHIPGSWADHADPDVAPEAAVLGVPAVFIAKTGRGYTDDQERRYGLVRHFQEARFEEAVATAEATLALGPETPRAARARLLEEKIDVTDWMVARFEETFAVD